MHLLEQIMSCHICSSFGTKSDEDKKNKKTQNFFHVQVWKMMAQWWNQVEEGWSLTATGRRKKPSSVEAVCLWERNSPQVHLILLAP